jgi:hypothetical protein
MDELERIEQARKEWQKQQVGFWINDSLTGQNIFINTLEAMQQMTMINVRR